VDDETKEEENGVGSKGGRGSVITVGVRSRGERGWRPEQAMTGGEKEGATASGGGEGGVGSRARKEKERALIMTAATGTTVVIARGTTLNSLIMGVIFE